MLYVTSAFWGRKWHCPEGKSFNVFILKLKFHGSCFRTARTLFRCEAENDSELSFEPNQIIKNGKLETSSKFCDDMQSGAVVKSVTLD